MHILIWLGVKTECHLCQVAGNTVRSHIARSSRSDEAGLARPAAESRCYAYVSYLFIFNDSC